MNIVEVINLKKEYPGFVLDNVSFEIEKGKITGFIGRNGAGKTTTIKSMLNLTHPNSGDVCYMGKSIYGNEAEIKKLIGYSTGTINWYPRKKLCDLASVVKRFYPLWSDDEYKYYLNLFQLDDSKTPLQMSEGMKVKCNLLLALSHGAELIILDEPTSGLDPFSRDELVTTFKQLKENRKAIFFSTHIITDLEKCADNIVYISKGKIIASTSLKDFEDTFSHPNENLEDTFLRLERGE